MISKNIKKFTNWLLIVYSFLWRGQVGSIRTTRDMFWRPYFMFMVHISPFSILKTILDVTVLGRPLWTKTTCCRSPSLLIFNALALKDEILASLQIWIKCKFFSWVKVGWTKHDILTLTSRLMAWPSPNWVL